MREKTIENYLVHRVRRDLDGLCLKLRGPVGWPDRTVILKGRLLHFVELKAPGKKPTKIQYWWHHRLARYGFHVLVFDSTEMVDEYVTYWMARERND